MQPLLTCQQMRNADSTTIKKIGISELILMEHAALGVVNSLKERFGKSLPQTRGLILAGQGNNGGDALVVAQILFHSGVKQMGLETLGPPKSAAAQTQSKILEQLGVRFQNSGPFDWIVDGLFGTGLTRPLEKPAQELIEKVNQLNAWKLAIDIPSGLCADTGRILGACFRADETCCLGFYKRGLFTGQAADCVGRVKLIDIQIPSNLGEQASCWLFEAADAKSALPPRPKTGHKATFGHVKILAGRPETEGAAILSCLGALRCGSGKVTLVGGHTAIESVRPRLAPEIMTEILSEAPLQADCLAVGPGMGTSAAHWTLLERLLSNSSFLVLDADALTLISANREKAGALLKQRDFRKTVLTPHPKEAAALLGSTVEKVEADRFQASQEIANVFHAIVVLKGKGSILSSPEGKQWVVALGTTALAKGGSGDALTGIIASFLAQPLEIQKTLERVALAVYLHGRASEIESSRQNTERAALASEIAAQLIPAIGELES